MNPLRPQLRRALGLAIATLALMAAPVAAQVTMPSNMLVYGTVTGSGSGGPAIAAGNVVNLVSIKANQIEASGTIQDSTGVYAINANLTQSSNGTLMTLELTTNGSVYQLLDSGTPVSFAFQGNFPFPASLGKNVTVGALISSPPAITATGSTSTTSSGTSSTASSSSGSTGTASTGTAGCPTILPKCDANGDGVFDQRDIDFIKQALGKHNPAASADVNGDGVVNSRDLLDAMRALSVWQRDQILGSASATGK